MQILPLLISLEAISIKEALPHPISPIKITGMPTLILRRIKATLIKLSGVYNFFALRLILLYLKN